MSMKQKLKETEELIQKLMTEQPKILEPYMMFLRRAEGKGAIDPKTKQLISIALSVALKCEWCISYHCKSALYHGATKEEIIETCMVATLLAGSPALMYTKLVLQALEDFKK